jgi:alkylated DNA nucleotide flippase Atl1
MMSAALDDLGLPWQEVCNTLGKLFKQGRQRQRQRQWWAAAAGASAVQIAAINATLSN